MMMMMMMMMIIIIIIIIGHTAYAVYCDNCYSWLAWWLDVGWSVTHVYFGWVDRFHFPQTS
jgi:hypothetical protein